MVLPVDGLRLPLHLKFNLPSAVIALGRYKGKSHLHRKAAALCKHLLNDALKLPCPVPVHHGILHGQDHPVFLVKVDFRLTEHGVLNDAVVLKFQQQALLIHIQQLLGGILV